MSLIKVVKLDDRATFDKAHEDDIGYDLTCVSVEWVRGGGRNPNRIGLKLGIKVQPPTMMYFQVYLRSSFPQKYNAIMANSVGIIDPGYRGEWRMQIIYFGHRLDAVCDDLIGKKVAQAVPMYLGGTQAEVEICDDLSNTKRGGGGFGYTGE